MQGSVPLQHRVILKTQIIIKSLVLFIVHSGIWQVTARSARCKNPTSTSASLQGEKASSKVIYLALIRGLLSPVIHCIFELAPELSFWQEHRQKKSRQSVIKSDKHKVNKRGWKLEKTVLCRSGNKEYLRKCLMTGKIKELILITKRENLMLL